MEVMPVGFWQHVLESDMAVPHGRPLNELTAELVTMLGSSNAVERDQTAFPVLAAWIAEGVYDDLLISLGDSLAQGLSYGLGRHDDDTVFRRSFSALALAECVKRDNAAHVLPVDAVLNWADRSLSWYVREQDLRGRVEAKGWADAVGHGADLMGVLAQSRHLGAPHLGVLLDVIGERMSLSSARILTDGEDDRAAAATLMILQRNLVSPDQVESWVADLGKVLVRPRGYSEQSWPSPSARNTSAYLRALYVHLAIGVHPTDATVSFAEPPECRADLLLALLAILPLLTPWLYTGPGRAPGSAPA
jgi:hypothetical protein